jgi:hypothetical protein
MAMATAAMVPELEARLAHWRTKKVVELKAECKAVGERVTGNKTDLALRLALKSLPTVVPLVPQVSKVCSCVLQRARSRRLSPQQSPRQRLLQHPKSSERCVMGPPTTGERERERERDDKMNW